MVDVNKSFSLLVGGGADTLDAFPYAALTSADFAFGIFNGMHHAYRYDTTLVKAATEAPYYIVPADNGTGTGAWVLQGYQGAMSHVKANTTAGQTIPNNSPEIIVYGTVPSGGDSLDEYNESTGVFTAKYAGEYFINASTRLEGGAWTFGNSYSLFVYKNTANAARIYMHYMEASVTLGTGAFSGTTTIKLAINDTIDIRVQQNIGDTMDLTTGATDNWLIIDRII